MNDLIRSNNPEFREERIFSDPSWLIQTRRAVNVALMSTEIMTYIPLGITQVIGGAGDIVEIMVALRRMMQGGLNIIFRNSIANKYARKVDLLPDVNPFLALSLETIDLTSGTLLPSYILSGFLQWKVDTRELQRREKDRLENY